MMVLGLSLLIAILDQATKVHITGHYLLGEYTTVVPGIFDIRYIRNTGAAWGMFHGFNDWLIVLSFVMVAAGVAFRRKLLEDTGLHRVVMGFLLGGIVGNLADRAKLGYVVDFLDFHWRGHSFPAFNVADASICIGVGLYMLSQVLSAGGGKGESQDAGGKEDRHRGVPG